MSTLPRWVWLFPVAQLLHGVEEYVEGYGFHGWLRGFREAAASPADLLWLHGGFTLAMLVAVVIASRVPRSRWLIAALAVLVLLNAAAHAVAAATSTVRTSGMLTAFALWLPLGTAALVYGHRTLSRKSFWSGCAIGALVQLPISWLAWTAGG